MAKPAKNCLMGFVFLLFIDKFILGTFEPEINDKNPVYLNTTLDYSTT